ncbi:MAG: hypothetical protein GY872_06550 [Roseibacillus sp.]|nr:hypothetical protein [Roseibacillus sp.]
MATNTLLQRLDPSAGTTGSSTAASNRRQIEEFLSSAAIVAGDVVGLDNTKTGPDRVLYVKQAAAVTHGNALSIGVALDAAAGAEERVRVVVAGYAEGVNCGAATIATGNPLVAGTLAGQVEVMANSDLTGLFAVALSGNAANKVDVHIFKRF